MVCMGKYALWGIDYQSRERTAKPFKCLVVFVDTINQKVQL